MSSASGRELAALTRANVDGIHGLIDFGHPIRAHCATNSCRYPRP